MKYRIVEIRHKGQDPYFQIEIKSWWTFWRWIGYASDDVHCYNTIEEAKDTIDWIKAGKPIRTTTTKIIHEV